VRSHGGYPESQQGPDDSPIDHPETDFIKLRVGQLQIFKNLNKNVFFYKNNEAFQVQNFVLPFVFYLKNPRAVFLQMS
jgi:hypothetical protein